MTKSVRDAVRVPDHVLPVYFDNNSPNSPRAWETVTWLNNLASSLANSRHHDSTDLSDARVSDRSALTSQCFPSRRLDLNSTNCLFAMIWSSCFGCNVSATIAKE